MTVGRGFGVHGPQGAGVLSSFFAKDPAAKNAMLHVGVTMDGNTPVVADTENQKVLRGDAALKHIEKSKPIYSQLANTAEGPAHIGNMTDAQFGVMRHNAADIPQEVIEGGNYTDPVSKKTVRIRHQCAHRLRTRSQSVGSAPYAASSSIVLSCGTANSSNGSSPITSTTTTRTDHTGHSTSTHQPPPPERQSERPTGRSASTKQADATDSSTNTERPPDLPRPSFRHPQVAPLRRGAMAS